MKFAFKENMFSSLCDETVFKHSETEQPISNINQSIFKIHLLKLFIMIVVQHSVEQ